MTRLEITEEADSSIIVASGTNVSSSLGRHFSYELSDKRAKANLLKGAAREVIEIKEKQKCIMLTFSVGAYLEVVIPTVIEWDKNELKCRMDEIEIGIEEVVPGYDDNNKHVETLVRFRVNGEKIVVSCYYTTQRIKVEGRGYIAFFNKFIQPLFCDRLRKVIPGKIDKY